MNRQLKRAAVILGAGAGLAACSAPTPHDTTARTTLAANALAACATSQPTEGAPSASIRSDRSTLSYFFLRGKTLNVAATALEATASAPEVSAASEPKRAAIVATLAQRIDDAVVKKNENSDELRRNPVIKNVMRLITQRKLAAFRSAVSVSPESQVMALLDRQPAGVSAANVKAIFAEAIEKASEANRPERLSYSDFENLYKSIVSQLADSRVIRYQAYYFNGKFVDRFGNAPSKASLSLTVTNEDISGVLTVLLESIADEIFPDTPVWTDFGMATDKSVKTAVVSADKAKYYPGGASTPPSALVFKFTGTDPTPEDLAKLAERLADPKSQSDIDACGMTKLKSEALMYLTGKASAWASGQSGLIMGFLGGVNIGLPIALGKLSVGDNKTLQTIVQTVLAFTARRATYEATWPLLYQIDERQYSTLGQLLTVLVFERPDAK